MPAEPAPLVADERRVSGLLRARLARSSAAIPAIGASTAPLTSTQRGLWYDTRVDPSGAAHHRPTVMRLRGPLDVGALQTALDASVRRQPALRTTYPLVGGEPVQRVLEPRPVQMHLVDATTDVGRATTTLDAVATRPFDIEHEAPFSATLIVLAPDDHLLALAVEHLSIDGPSADVLVADLAESYASAVGGVDPHLLDGGRPVLRSSFAAWAAWHEGRIDEASRERALDWWSFMLANRAPAEPLALDPSDATRHAVGVASIGGSVDLGGRSGLYPVTVEVPAAVVEGLRSLARSESVTINATVMAAFSALWWDDGGLDDIVVGMPLSDRDHPDLAGVVGCFVRVLPVRLRSGATDTRRGLVRRAGATVNAVLDHRAVSLPEIMWSVSPRDRSGAVSEVLQAVVQTRTADTARALGAAGVDFELVPLVVAGPGPSVTVSDRGEITVAAAVPDDDRAPGGSPRAAGALGAALVEQLARLVDDPDRPLRPPRRSPPARQCPTGDNLVGPRPPGEAGDPTLTELFAETEATHGPRIAVREVERVVTYTELGELARATARQLSEHGIGPGRTVGVQFERSIDCVVAMLAVVLTGAAYVPLDELSPPERTAMIVDDAGLSAVMRASGIEWLPPADASGDGRGPVELPQGSGADAPVYVMYTSGSTGRPKGVVVHHRAIVQLVRDGYLHLDVDEVVGFASTTTFDVATYEVWGALLNGACLAVIDVDTLVDPDRLEARIAEWGVTTLQPTTSLFHALARRRPGVFAGLRQLGVGGEAIEPRWAGAVLDAGPPARFVHDYGPTETTTTATYYEISEVPPLAVSVPIGRPLDRVSLEVVDERGRPVPAGVPGELVIGGAGVARGYLGRPELTAERFVPDPGSTDPDARRYRSGDVVVARTDGLIEFLGRADSQVKVRGYRIELGEIEAALIAHPGVDLAAASVWRSDGDPIVVGYVVVNSPATTSDELLDHLRGRIPAYMLPATIVALDALPLTPNGKVDRRALPDPRPGGAGASASRAGDGPGAAGVQLVETVPARGIRAGPARDLELMVGVWSAVLAVDAVDPDADFFDIGGHSLRALTLLAAVEDTFGVDLRIADLIAAPTARRLAGLVVTRDRVAHPGGLIELNPGPPDGPVLHLVPAGIVIRWVSDYRLLLRHLDTTERVVTYEPPGLAPGTAPLDSIPRLARWYCDRVVDTQPTGPVHLAGHSVGGIIALEAARRLVAAGREVPAVVLLDPRLRDQPLSTPVALRAIARNRVRRSGDRLRLRLGHGAPSQGDGPTNGLDDGRRVGESYRLQHDLARSTHLAWARYRPSPYDGPTTLITTSGVEGEAVDRAVAATWMPYLPGATVVEVPGRHSGTGSLLDDPHVERTAEVLRRVLAG